MEQKKITKPAIITMICTVAVAIIMITIVFNVHAKSANRLTEQLTLGENYLSELNYEQAIIAYETAIQIDPKCEEAYLGLADVYVNMAQQAIEEGDYNAAIGYYNEAVEVLEKGYKTTDSDRIREKREEVADLIAEAEQTIKEQEEVQRAEAEQAIREQEEAQRMEEEQAETEQEEVAGKTADDATEEWIVDLYNKLTAQKFEEVLQVMKAEDFLDKCAAYKDANWSWWDYETAYRLPVSDGKTVGVIAYKFEDGNFEMDVFYCEHFEEGGAGPRGFDVIENGDLMVTYTNDGYSWFDGNDLISHSTSLESGKNLDIVSVWHM